MLRSSRFFAPFLTILCALACSKGSTPTPTAAQQSANGAETTESEAPVRGAEGDADEITTAPASAGTAAGSAGLLAEAQHVLETLTESTYSHKTHVEGTAYDVDCSGFVDYLLARVDPPALAELRSATVQRPLAKHFVSFLASDAPKQHWQRLSRVQDLAPGDIVAWERPADVTSTNTGHVMLVAAPPEQRNAAEWTLPIIDSTGAPHGKRDARKQAHATGVGRGMIVLETDAAGIPIAYHWTEILRSPAHSTKIALGRVL